MKHLKKFENYSSNRVDELLDKINDQGIDSLTDEEKEILKSNGILPGGEEKPTYKDSYGYGDDDIDPDDIDDDEPLFHKSDLSDMAESDNLKGVSKDWLKRRDKARELYDLPNDPTKIMQYIQDILEYISDKKNAPIFKEKVIKFSINNLEYINNKGEKNEFLIKIINYLKEFLKYYQY